MNLFLFTINPGNGDFAELLIAADTEEAAIQHAKRDCNPADELWLLGSCPVGEGIVAQFDFDHECPGLDGCTFPSITRHERKEV